MSFDLRPGEVHALMGENGAGKSTLMKILAGNVARDAGVIEIDGQRVEIATPADARRHGIAIIHQELNTVPYMSVAENLALGKEPKTRFGMLDRQRMTQDAADKLDRIGAKIDVTQPLGSLSIGMQQMVEIARAVGEEARVLVLDEPTAALSRTESEQLYSLIGQMRADGVGLIYISHRMEEVWRLADRITVLRDGRYVGTEIADDLTEGQIVSMMVGRDIADLYGHGPREPREPLLRVEGLRGNGVGPFDLTVHAGEVVCVAGLIGAGRTEMARLIFGADARTGGQVWIHGTQSAPVDPAAAIAQGIGMVPEDRKSEGLFLEHSVKDNIAISTLEDLSWMGILRRPKLRAAVSERMAQLRLRSNAIDLPVEALSGGNQQKAAVARWLLRDSQVLILDEPTRGVDIGAKREIYDLIDTLARQGKAILVISSDLPEAIGIGDRVLVVRDGRIVHDMPSAEATEEIVMLHATGARAATAQATQHKGARP
ncbi:sugar ABC transporter ATP-binding protein [Nereida ignava]|nr:sugar ABC transporter ATP-binding protein [Nereida ignava]